MKRSLYKQSLLRNASSSSFTQQNLVDNQQDEKHWVRGWYDPPKLKDNLNNSNITNPNSAMGSVPPSTTISPATSQSNTPAPVSTYGFKVKTWILADNYEPLADGPVVDFIDLNEFPYIRPVNKNPGAGDSGANDNNALTDADIRGAVGGSDLPSFSSSTAHQMKEDEAKAAAKSTETDVDLTETPVNEEISITGSQVAGSAEVLSQVEESAIKDTTEISTESNVELPKEEMMEIDTSEGQSEPATSEAKTVIDEDSGPNISVTAATKAPIVSFPTNTEPLSEKVIPPEPSTAPDVTEKNTVMEVDTTAEGAAPTDLDNEPISTELPATESTVTGQTSIEQTATEQASTEQTATEQIATEQTATEATVAEPTVTEPTAAESAVLGSSVPESSVTGATSTVDSAAEVGVDQATNENDQEDVEMN